MLCGGSRNPGQLEVSLGSPLRNLASSSGPGLTEELRATGWKHTSQTFRIQTGTISTPCNNNKILAIKLFVLKVINTFFW